MNQRPKILGKAIDHSFGLGTPGIRVKRSPAERRAGLLAEISRRADELRALGKGAATQHLTAAFVSAGNADPSDAVEVRRRSVDVAAHALLALEALELPKR